DEPFEPCPYSPASRLFWNEFYVDVGQSRRAAKSDTIDYRKEMSFRRGILEKDAEAFFKTRRSDAHTRFDAFLKQEPEIDQYARFRATTEKQGKGWNSWPAALRDGKIPPTAYDRQSERYHLYAQWRIQDEIRALANKTRRNGQLLYLDPPLGLHPDSYDIR